MSSKQDREMMFAFMSLVLGLLGRLLHLTTNPNSDVYQEHKINLGYQNKIKDFGEEYGV